MTPEERLAELLRALPAPPTGWVEAAKQLPAARRELATLWERIEHDERAAGEGDRGPRGAAPRGGRRADADRRRPPAHPARGMTSTTRGVELAGVTLGGLHDVLAEPGPGPAGGSAAALATTMAAGLVRLVARVSPDWDEAPGIAAQAAALGDRALLLADDDHRVYARALAQLGAPARDAALGEALRHAARVPAPDRRDRGRRRGARGAGGARGSRRGAWRRVGGGDARGGRGDRGEPASSRSTSRPARTTT